MKKMILILIGLSSLSMATFTKTGDIVSDDITGLEWQDDTVGSAMNWRDAIIACEALTLGSFSNWRLANKNELLTLVDDTKNNASISSVFENTQGSSYWTSTTTSEIKGNAWSINFESGSMDGNSKYASAYVRCVREVP